MIVSCDTGCVIVYQCPNRAEGMDSGMAVFAIVRKAGKDDKVDARNFLVAKEVAGDVGKDSVIVGYTLKVPGVVPLELDDKYRPLNAVDTARACEIWVKNQSGWNKASKDFFRFQWSACSAFTVNRETRIAGAKGYGCSTPTTLAATVNSNKRGDSFSA